jgi:hypothetical protein
MNIPAELQNFLRNYVETYEQLEVLLVIAREPERAWPEQEVRAMIAAPSRDADAAVKGLAASGVLADVSTDTTVRLQAASSHRDHLRLLLEAYRTNALGLMNQLTANAIERVRTSALRAFSGAFVLNRRRDG